MSMVLVYSRIGGANVLVVAGDTSRKRQRSIAPGCWWCIATDQPPNGLAKDSENNNNNINVSADDFLDLDSLDLDSLVLDFLDLDFLDLDYRILLAVVVVVAVVVLVPMAA
jgi:hypothetical protein